MAWFHRDGPYCMSNATFDTRNMNPWLVELSRDQIPCAKTSNSSVYNCTSVLSDTGMTTVFWFDQNFTTSIVSTPRGSCFQLDGIPNADCNATSMIITCQNPEWSQPECLLLSGDTGKCLQEDDPAPKIDPKVEMIERCTFANGQAFNCQHILSPPCQLLDGTSPPHNCSAICSTPELLFDSVASFTFCAAQAIGLPSSTDTTVWNIMGKSYVPQLIVNESLHSILPLTNACMEEYCTAPVSELGGSCPYMNYTSMQDFLHDCSQNVAVRLDSDVGGIGVTISYLAQATIAIYFWVSIRGYDALHWLSPRLTRKWGDHLPILRSAVVEFQETQAFFVAAIQIGITTIISRRLGTFESYSTTQSDWNNQFLLLIESAGLYTISLPLLLLQAARMDSWYILVISFFSFALALAGIAFSRGDKFPDTIVPIPQASFYKKCGGNSPPIALCPTLRSFHGNNGHYERTIEVNFTELTSKVRRDSFPTTVQTYPRSVDVPLAPFNIGMAAFWMLVIVYVLLRKTCFAFHESSKRRRERKTAQTVSSSDVCIRPRHSTDIEAHSNADMENATSENANPESVAEPTASEAESEAIHANLRIVDMTVSLILEFLAVGMIVSVVISFRNWIASGVIALDDWTIGKVIALFIWAPVVFKYFYWTMFGMKGHSNVRIAKPYRIEKVDFESD